MVWVIAGTAFVLKVLYVLMGTSFQDSLHNDMAVYWRGAFRDNWGDAMSMEQYAIFPPFYIYFLALLIKGIFFLGYSTFSLELVLVFNIALYCFSSFFVYSVLMKFVGDRWTAVFGQVFYLFSYTALNMQALVLPDNMATPLLVMAFGLAVLSDHRPSLVFIIGLLLGLAIAAKPFFVFFGLVFLWFEFTKAKTGRGKAAVIFMAGLSIFPAACAIRNYQISEGKIIGLGANGGVNFFQGWGEVGSIYSQAGDGTYFVDSPGNSEESSWPDFSAEEPFYNQEYFYRKGVEAIANDPRVLVRKVGWLKKLFFGSLGPFLSHHPAYYSYLRWATDLLMYFIFFMGLGFSFLLKKKLPANCLRLILLLLATFAISIYGLGMPERRYLYYVEFLMIILFFTSLNKAVSLFRVYQNEIKLAFWGILAFFVCLPAACLVVHYYVG